MKRILKIAANGISLTLTFLPAALSCFGRIAPVFVFFGQWFSLFPGVPGDYLRIAYYVLTLRKCAIDSHISCGTFLGKSGSIIGHRVYIGARCVFGECSIGDRTQIGDHVLIPSGRRQHPRDEQGRIQGAERGNFGTVTIGPDCWIGSAAIVMENVGARSTIGAGSVVTKPVPEDTVAAGNPARTIRSR